VTTTATATTPAPTPEADAGRIVVSGLTKTFGAITAVADLRFTVEPGTVTGFLGPNGAGKTTTLRMVLGLVAPDRGDSTISGRRFADLVAPSSEVGAVLDSAGFHPQRSGRDHLRVYSAVSGYPRHRAGEVLQLVGLYHAGHRPVRAYSLGMRQRLALATALLGDPRVLVLDEPGNGLDPEGIAWMRKLLRQLADEGRTVLVSSHLLAEVQQLVDHVVIINHGRLVHQGPLAGWASPTSSVRTPQAGQLAAALAGSAIDPRPEVERTGPDCLRVVGAEPAAIGRIALAEGIELHELAPDHGGLEQFFLQLTAEPVASAPAIDEVV
jgi:ABC-2 type transport system ATP-binding protein